MIGVVLELGRVAMGLGLGLDCAGWGGIGLCMISRVGLRLR